MGDSRGRRVRRKGSRTVSDELEGCTMGYGPHCTLPQARGGGQGAGAHTDAGSRAETRGEEQQPVAQAPAPAHGDAPQHDHQHDHGGRGRGHAHGIGGMARSAGRSGLIWVLAITATFMVAELVGGWISGSLALMADAAHMLTDVASIGLSLFALSFARRPATPEKTYGYLRLEILAALLNGALLIGIAVFIFLEAWHRLVQPHAVRGALMLAVALAGLAANIAAAAILHRSAGESLNVRGAYLHVLSDLLGSAGAALAAAVILAVGWLAADPIISIVVGVLILASSWTLLRESVDILLEAVPAHIDMEEVRLAIDDVPGVNQVHDLHVWTVTSGFLAMSGHAIVADPEANQAVLEEIHHRMRDRFGIRHATIQLERRPQVQLRRRHEPRL